MPWPPSSNQAKNPAAYWWITSSRWLKKYQHFRAFLEHKRDCLQLFFRLWKADTIAAKDLTALSAEGVGEYDQVLLCHRAVFMDGRWDALRPNPGSGLEFRFKPGGIDSVRFFSCCRPLEDHNRFHCPSGPNVLAQVASNSGSTFNLIWVIGARHKSLDVSVKMKAVSGREDQGGGLVWRGRDANNYYVARYNPLEENYRVYKVVQGRRIQLQSADVRRSEGWHVLRVTMEGGHIQCFYDGQKLLDVEDSTFQEEGQIGLWTKADAQTRFDDLTLIVK